MRILGVLACGLALGGCATVTRGSTEQIQFDSMPVGAEVRTALLPLCDQDCADKMNRSQDPGSRMVEAGRTENGPSCTTSCTATFDRNRVIIATFSRPGYEPQTVRLEPTLASTGALGMAGNAVAGGVTGLLVDAASGAAMDHCPNPVVVTLRRANSRDPRLPVNMACKTQKVHDPNGPIEQAVSTN
jgi:hypothetical protein